MDNKLESLDQETLDAPKSRIKDAHAGWKIYDRMRLDDKPRSRARSLIQRQFDGDVPYNQSKLRQANQGHKTNVNFLEGDAARGQALSPFFDLVYSVDTLATIKTKYGDENQRVEWSQIISEEFHKMLTNWSQFSNRVQELANGFVVYGLSFPYFETTQDWKFKVGRLGNIKIPDGTPVDEDEIELMCIEQDMSPSDLYKIISKPAAEQRGWKPDACKRAILAYANKESSNKYDNWETLQQSIKNNDLYFSCGPGAQRVPVVHYIIKEFDGNYTHCIGLQDETLPGNGQAPESEWLFHHDKAFSDANQAFLMFNFGTGNGTIHSIRGLGFKLYPLLQVLNRVRCHAIDSAILSMGVMAQPENSDMAVDLGMTRIVPGAGLNILPANLKLSQNAVPDLSRAGFPVMQEMQRLIASNSGNFQTHEVNPTSVERTAQEIRAQLERDSILQNNALNMWYVPWGKLLKQIYIRAIKGVDKASKEFISECEKRGVPIEALKQYGVIKEKRATGNGSPQLRGVAQKEVFAVSGSFDEVGRNNATKDYLLSIPGVDSEAAERYLPKTEPRPTIDHEFAQLENSAIMAGADIQVLSNQNHLVHAQIHLAKIMEDMQGMTEGQVDPRNVISTDIALLEHVKDHQEQGANDEQKAQDWAQINQQIQQIEAYLDKVEQETAQKMQAEAAEQAKQQGQLTPEQQQELEFEAEKSRIKIEEQKALAEIRVTTASTENNDSQSNIPMGQQSPI